MLAFITGSGFYHLPGLESTTVTTPFGDASMLRGAPGGLEILLLPRHGEGHRNLPHHINYRANLSALKQAGATAIVTLSVCGVVDPGLPLGEPLVASDIYFPENRLPNGEACTIFTEPGAPGRGHLLADSLLNDRLTQAAANIAEQKLGRPAPTGVYAHVNGPRFNTRAEIAQLREAQACFLSQTGGPEAVLANELELPFALVGFGVDYANGVAASPTPVETLRQNLEASRAFFENIVAGLHEPNGGFSFTNYVYRFES